MFRTFLMFDGSEIKVATFHVGVVLYIDNEPLREERFHAFSVSRTVFKYYPSI